MNLGGPHKLFQEYTKLTHACYAILAKDYIFAHEHFRTCILSGFEQIKMTQLLLYLFLFPKTLQQNKWHKGYE